MYVEDDGRTPLSNQMVTLNVALLKKNAPSDRFVVHIFNRSEAGKLLDLPREWPRCGNDGACFSDLVRTAIMAQRGGIYIDADVIVNKPLTQIADDLKQFDIVSYASRPAVHPRNLLIQLSGDQIGHRRLQTRI